MAELNVSLPAPGFDLSLVGDDSGEVELFKARAATSQRKSTVLKSATVSMTLDAVTESEITNLGGVEFKELDRAQDYPLVRFSGRKLPKMTLTAMLYGARGRPPAYEQIATLKQLADSLTPITVAFSSYESTGSWYITDAAVKPLKRYPGNNNIRQAEVTLQLTRKVDERLQAPSAKPPAKAPPRKKTPKHYTMKKGEKLAHAAQVVCHDASHWPTIAKDNKIKNPNRIKPGYVLSIYCY